MNCTFILLLYCFFHKCLALFLEAWNKKLIKAFVDTMYTPNYPKQHTVTGISMGQIGNKTNLY